ncbi:MAG: hypothetical protein LBE13_18355 [Bacteroidales bacterium]|jgi:hypothetical protein|nr:hypothetical protein [Bacteroidales bacterium]
MKSIKGSINRAKSNLTLSVLGLFLMSVIISCTQKAQKIDSTESLMKEISARYNGKWFTHLTFSQTVDTYENGLLVKTDTVEVWDEEYYFPSNLVIYETPGDTSNRYICRNDSLFIYKDGILTHEEEGVTHDGVILSMDIYNMTYDEIMMRLGDLKYDISKFHETTYKGRKVYVMGAEQGDTTSYQAWFDAEHLYLIRFIKPVEGGVREVELLDYIQIGESWIEQEYVFKRNGELYMKEKYFNIKIVATKNNDKDNQKE